MPKLKKYTKKPAPKKVETTAAPVPELAKETPPAEQPTIRNYYYKFIATCSNLNIANVIFDNTKVIIYEVKAPTYEVALKQFRDKYMALFNGNEVDYNKFLSCVFGDDILVEVIPAVLRKTDRVKLH